MVQSDVRAAGVYTARASNIDGNSVSGSAYLVIRNACPTDIDANGAVSFTDLLAVISSWGSCP